MSASTDEAQLLKGWTVTASKLHRNDDGALPAYAWPGGYPVYYLTADIEVEAESAEAAMELVDSDGFSQPEEPDWQDTDYEMDPFTVEEATLAEAVTP